MKIDPEVNRGSAEVLAVFGTDARLFFFPATARRVLVWRRAGTPGGVAIQALNSPTVASRVR